MKSQRDCFALHFGRWVGVFTTYDPQTLKIQQQKRSVITFEETEPGVVTQTNTYALMDPENPDSTNSSRELPPTQSWTYRSMSPAIRYFENGSFSNGRLQWAPFNDFGVEQGFIHGDEKVRLVQLFDTQGQLSSLIVIQEYRGVYQDPSPTLHSPVGLWQGQSTTFKNQDYVPESQTIAFRIPTVQGLSLPGNLWVTGSLSLPSATSSQRDFTVELAWMPDPDHYFKLVRRYDVKGSWQDIEFIAVQRQD